MFRLSILLLVSLEKGFSLDVLYIIVSDALVRQACQIKFRFCQRLKMLEHSSTSANVLKQLV